MDSLIVEQKVRCWDRLKNLLMELYKEDPHGSGLALRWIVEGIEHEIIEGEKNANIS